MSSVFDTQSIDMNFRCTTYYLLPLLRSHTFHIHFPPIQFHTLLGKQTISPILLLLLLLLWPIWPTTSQNSTMHARRLFHLLFMITIVSIGWNSLCVVINSSDPHICILNCPHGSLFLPGTTTTTTHSTTYHLGCCQCCWGRWSNSSTWWWEAPR